MKITFDQKSFLKKLQFLMNGMPKTAIIPTDSWIYSKISTNGEMRIKISNSEVEMETFLKVTTKIENDIELCFPGSLFSRTMLNIDDGDIQMNFQMNDKDEVKSVTVKPLAKKNKKYKIAVIANCGDFSHWPDLNEEVEKEFTFDASLFNEALNNAATSISARDDVRPGFNHFNFYPYKDKLYINGCSEMGQCFITTDIPFENGKLINRKTASYVSSFDSDELCEVIISESRVLIKNGSESIKTTVILNKLYDFSQFLDNDPEHYFNVDRIEMLEAMKMLILFNAETVANFKVEKNELTITSKASGGVSEGENIIEIDNPNDVEFECGLKLNQIQKIFTSMKHSKTISVGNSKSIIFLKNNPPKNKLGQIWLASQMK